MDLRRLSPWQRVQRRFALLGGSYRHPDGHLELDFEAAAGINRRDDDEQQAAKLAAYERRQAEFSSRFWPFLIGVAVGAALIHYKPSLWPF